MRILTFILCLLSFNAFAEVTPEQFAKIKEQAEKGDAVAQCNLGVYYYKGEGVLKDLVEAYAYYNLAGITLEDARENRDNLEKEMTPSQREAGVKRSKELQAEIEARRKK